LSLNSLIPKTTLINLEALSVLLIDCIAEWRNAETEDSRLAVEAKVISLIEKVIELDFEFEQVVQGSHLELNELETFYNEYFYIVRANLVRLQSIIRLFIAHSNTRQFITHQLTGRLKRIQQKQASLDIWKEDSKFAYAERFLNFDNLTTESNNLPLCNVDNKQGVLTLPQASVSEVKIKNIVIGGKSNGRPGNSDSDISNNQNPLALLASSGQFEYERLDSGPCILQLVCELSQVDIVNSVSIEPSLIGGAIDFEIRDIVFNKNSLESISIFDLVEKDLDKDFFNVSSLSKDSEWKITHLPVQAKSITFLFSTTSSSIIETATGSRERFGISLKSIKLNKVAYGDKGGIVSKQVSLPDNLFAGISFLDLYPKNSQLFTSDIEVSVDSGQTWQKDRNSSPEIGSTFLLNGIQNSLMWRLNIARNPEAFLNVKSLMAKDLDIFLFDSLLRTGSRENSPLEIKLPDTIESNVVFAMQPKILARGKKDSAIKLSEGKDQEIQVVLPITFEKERHINSFRVFVNNVEYTYSGSTPGALQYALSDDNHEILFDDSVKLNSEIKILLNKENLFFRETSDGFVAETDFVFDPDKSAIELEFVSKKKQLYNQILPQDEKLVKLEANTIDDSTFNIISDTGVALTPVSNRDDVISTANSYYLRPSDGFLELNSVTGVNKYKVVYSAQEKKTIAAKDFELALVHGKPQAIVIPKDKFVSDEKTETIGSLMDRYPELSSLSIDSLRTRTSYFANSTNNKQLSYPMVIPGSVTVSVDLFTNSLTPIEVPHIDGRTEFLGLIEMKDEETVSISSGGNNYVEFSLSAGEYFYHDMEVYFEDSTSFADEQDTRAEVLAGSVGDYHIDDAGLVTVNVGVGNVLPSGIKISYFYQDPTFSKVNKYSINYRKGLLFAGSNLNQSATINYKSASYVASYNLANILESVYDSKTNIISVKTETLHPVNNLVKIVWSKTKSESSLKEIENYFSPIVNIVGFRMN
jgi:hypothetical protein